MSVTNERGAAARARFPHVLLQLAGAVAPERSRTWGVRLPPGDKWHQGGGEVSGTRRDRRVTL